jgi:hypothetical protein
LHEKKEEDSISKYVVDVIYKAPPLLPDVNLLNKQFRTYTLEPVGVCLELYSPGTSVVSGVPVKYSFHENFGPNIC